MQFVTSRSEALDKLNKYIEILNLRKYMDVIAANLSFGQQKKLALLRIFLNNSDLIISGINEKNLPEEIIVFPNPSNGIFFLSKKVEKLKVLDSRGSMLFSDENTDIINLTRTNRGIYYLFICLLYTSPSPRDATIYRIPSYA